METRSRVPPSDSSVPFFPYRLTRHDGGFTAENHLTEAPLFLNEQAAEVLRLADGVAALSDIVARLAKRYPDAGGPACVRSRVMQLLSQLTESALVWWREVPMELVPAGPPKSVFWEITAACNLRCLHCVVAAGPREPRELETPRLVALASELAGFGVEEVAFSGGEPLIHRDFWALAEHVRMLGMTIQVATNATLVTQETARRLRDVQATVQVSLDGSKPEVHDILRPGRNAFEQTVAGIRNLVAAGHAVTVAAVLSRVNIDDIPNILALAGALGAAGFRLIPFVPKGRGGSHSEMEVSPAQSRRIAEELCSLRRTIPLEVAPLEFEDMLGNRAREQACDLEQHIGCGGGFEYATITPTGQLLPCHFFEGVRADSVAERPFVEVWRRSRFLNYFRHLAVRDLHGECSTCGWLASCRGGCRAVNFAKGDLLGKNAACWVA